MKIYAGLWGNDGPAPIQPPPNAGSLALTVIMPASFMAERAVILMPSVGTGMDPDVADAILIRIKIRAGNNGGLDIE